MNTDLSQVVAEKMQSLSLSEQRKVVEFVENLAQPKRMTLFEKIEKRVGCLSAETLEKLPKDGAENLDHYLYGAPKKAK